MGLGYTKAAMVYVRTRGGHRGYQRVTRNAAVPIIYTNAKGKTYYLRQGTTKTEKPKYYFSMESNGGQVEYSNCLHFDTDDCFRLSTDPPLPHQRDHTER